MGQAGSFEVAHLSPFSYPKTIFSATLLSHFVFKFRASSIILRRLTFLPLATVRASSICARVMVDSGQSWQMRAGVMPSLLAISAHEDTLPSLNCRAHVCILRTTVQGSWALPNNKRFRKKTVLGFLVEFIPFSKGIDTRNIFSPAPPWAAISFRPKHIWDGA
jgi:hypothetical protein